MHEPSSPVGKRPLPKEWPITSNFGDERNGLAAKLGLKSIKHNGVDFGSKKDNKTGKIIESVDGKQIMAYQDGKCIICHDNGDGFGLRVWIEHGGYKDGYCHLKTAFINMGDRVKQGEVIALVGNTGKSTAPHLHFETRLDNVPVKPLFYENT